MARPIEELKKLYRVELPDDFPYTEDELWEMLGDPEDWEQEGRLREVNLQAYLAMARDLIESHPRKWAVFVEAELRAICDTQEEALRIRDELGLQPSCVLVKYLPSPSDVWRL